jgi:hypothetical protein
MKPADLNVCHPEKMCHPEKVCHPERGLQPESRDPLFSIVNRQSSIGNAFALLLATLREIFDENAYARFLQHYRLEPSRASYAAFLRENASRRERRPRCC